MKIISRSKISLPQGHLRQGIIHNWSLFRWTTNPYCINSSLPYTTHHSRRLRTRTHTLRCHTSTHTQCVPTYIICSWFYAMQSIRLPSVYITRDSCAATNYYQTYKRMTSHHAMRSTK